MWGCWCGVKLSCNITGARPRPSIFVSLRLARLATAGRRRATRPAPKGPRPGSDALLIHALGRLLDVDSWPHNIRLLTRSACSIVCDCVSTYRTRCNICPLARADFSAECDGVFGTIGFWFDGRLHMHRDQLVQHQHPAPVTQDRQRPQRKKLASRKARSRHRLRP